MLTPLQNYFHYSRGERRGTVALFSIVTLLIGFYFVKDIVYQPENVSVNVQEFEAKIAAFNTEELVVEKESVNSYFLFDPNTIGVEEWILLGFSQKQAESIENYKASGAVFKIKKDLLKLFMVDESKYAQLESYIDLPEAYEENKYKNESVESYYSKEVYAVVLAESPSPIYEGFEDYENVHYSKKNNVYQYCILPFESHQEADSLINELKIENGQVISLSSTKGYYAINQKKTDSQKKFENNYEQLEIDLNAADTSDLKKLYGIGSGYANRIVNYREVLGGFIDLDQLNEVYGLQKETIDQIQPYLYLGEITEEKLNINEATVDELKMHPYIEWKVANSIVQIRNNYGKFASIEGIKKSKLMDEELFEKIKPYIEAK